ncbi:DNA-binding transcriptional regulator, Lrp family [Oryzisolibacter propanilivorax]|uniref:siroheme decarboxylase n=1 Tax=Oryzisolibacter propanilivorax TaxID=1527607 RepID=A0A1G9PBL0_9BURK|nr:Lrp/AsnC family transcriptional regulator [Oryzisolibacter propanilivorax]SDL96139.1 DNA-binding transcriptional regulator, Lrp family [Oryzisolibacter propanilivorax]
MHRQHPADLALLNDWQRGFPLCARPFAAIGRALGLEEDAVLAHYARLQRAGAVSRIGAVFAPGAGGASTLAAMAVPPARLAQVARQVSAHPGVNHNYEREHALNLWFVATGADTPAVEALLRAIEAQTALPVLRLPMLRPYRIDTAFDLRVGPCQARPTRAAGAALAPTDWPLAALAEQGLAPCHQPYADWARRLGVDESAVLADLRRWLAAGTLARFGVVVRHHELGFAANAMAVFDVPDAQADAFGQALAHRPGVTLAYRRARAPGWPYNLYCMVHGRDRAAVQAQLLAARAGAGLLGHPYAVLFSARRFKQTGARRFAASAPAPLAEALNA